MVFTGQAFVFQAYNDCTHARPVSGFSFVESVDLLLIWRDIIKCLIELLLEEREVSPSVTSSVSAAATKNPKDPHYFG